MLRLLRCSFCRKNNSEVEKLVAGPRAYTGARVYICDACVAIATQIMSEPPSNDTGPDVQLSIRRKVSHRIKRFFGGNPAQRIELPIAS